jgi:predicted DNA-binding protein (UPF0251 family)
MTLARPFRVVEKTDLASGKHRMSITSETLRLDKDAMCVNLSAGRKIGVQQASFSRLIQAAQAKRQICQPNRRDPYLETLGEDASIARLLVRQGGGRE